MGRYLRDGSTVMISKPKHNHLIGSANMSQKSKSTIKCDFTHCFLIMMALWISNFCLKVSWSIKSTYSGCVNLWKNQQTIKPQPPHSPDLDTCDFLQFPKLKITLNEKRFSTIERTKTESLIKVNENRIWKVIQRFEKALAQVKKEYFEGDNLNIQK